VDQTGAIDVRRGAETKNSLHRSVKAKPLPCCWITSQVVEFGELADFNLRSLQETLGFSSNAVRMQVAIDAVLGLPRSHPMPWRTAILEAGAVEGLGREVAEAFFSDLARELPIGDDGLRTIDRKVGAMSVFQSKPYQRNVQTGTFRVWRDLGRDPHWFFVPELENKSSGIPIFEAYPSYSWFQILGMRRRSPELLSNWLKSESNLGLKWTSEHQRLVEKSPDHADAFVIALALLLKNGEMSDTQRSNEGWILGVPRDSL
jgi:hypothetical protein